MINNTKLNQAGQGNVKCQKLDPILYRRSGKTSLINDIRAETRGSKPCGSLGEEHSRWREERVQRPDVKVAW